MRNLRSVGLVQVVSADLSDSGDLKGDFSTLRICLTSMGVEALTNIRQPALACSASRNISAEALAGKADFVIPQRCVGEQYDRSHAYTFALVELFSSMQTPSLGPNPTSCV